jgi:hypothetical protein
VAAAPAAPPATVSPKPASVTRRSAEKAAEASPQAAYEDDSDKRLAKGHGTVPSLDESVRKADRLFTEQSWDAAAEAYRDLLRRYPAHKDAAKWRSRMDQSLVAERERRAATGGKAAKANPLPPQPSDATKH